MSNLVPVGFWRPFDYAAGRGCIASPDYRMRDSYLADASKARDGKWVTLQIADHVIALHGSKEAVLRHYAQQAEERANAEFALPMPIEGSLTDAQAVALASWLSKGQRSANYMGMSSCRICGRLNGSADMVRDGYVYPEGLLHYVLDHRVAVPGLEHLI